MYTYFSCIHDGTQASGNATAQEADRLKRSLLVDLGHTDFMTHREF